MIYPVKSHTDQPAGDSAPTHTRFSQIVEASPAETEPSQKTGRGAFEIFAKLPAMWSAQSRAERVARGTGAGAGQAPGLDFTLIMICVAVLIITALTFAGVL